MPFLAVFGLLRGEAALVERRLDEGLEGDEVPRDDVPRTLAAVPGEVLRGEAPLEEAPSPRAPHRHREEQREAAVHERELEPLRLDDRAEAARRDVGEAEQRAGADRQPLVPARHPAEQHAEHQEVRRGKGEHEDGQGPHRAGAAPVSLEEEVRDRVPGGVTGFPREERREEQRPDVVRHAEHEPVRQAVQVRVFPDAEDPAVPRGDERDDEGGEAQRAPREEVVLGALRWPAGGPDPEPYRGREVRRHHAEIERPHQNPRVRPARKLRVAPGKNSV